MLKQTAITARRSKGSLGGPFQCRLTRNHLHEAGHTFLSPLCASENSEVPGKRVLTSDACFSAVGRDVTV
jgi:hypothetical protein